MWLSGHFRFMNISKSHRLQLNLKHCSNSNVMSLPYCVNRWSLRLLDKLCIKMSLYRHLDFPTYTERFFSLQFFMWYAITAHFMHLHGACIRIWKKISRPLRVIWDAIWIGYIIQLSSMTIDTLASTL